MEQGRVVDRGPMMGFFRQLEERLLLPEVRSSGDELSRLPTDNFIELGSSGAIYTKQQIIDSLAQEKTMERSTADFSIQVLAEGVVLLTYHSTCCDSGTGQEWHSLRSSIWKRNDTRWQ
jgi:hypothetical protein